MSHSANGCGRARSFCIDCTLFLFESKMLSAISWARTLPKKGSDNFYQNYLGMWIPKILLRHASSEQYGLAKYGIFAENFRSRRRSQQWKPFGNSWQAEKNFGSILSGFEDSRVNPLSNGRFPHDQNWIGIFQWCLQGKMHDFSDKRHFLLIVVLVQRLDSSWSTGSFLVRSKDSFDLRPPPDIPCIDWLQSNGYKGSGLDNFSYISHRWLEKSWQKIE